MRNYGLANSFENEQRSVADLIAEIATSTSDVTLRSAAALAQVRRGVITGEGPTVAGRAHFSRSIDADDTALCARILILAGRAGDPVSRAEAEALFDINTVAGDRRMEGASMTSVPRRSSGTVTVPGGDQRPGILPRRPHGHCGASVVAALAVTNRMEDSVKLTDTQLMLLSAAYRSATTVPSNGRPPPVAKTNAFRRHIDLAWVRPGIGDKFRNGFRGKRWMHHHDARRAADGGDWHDIADEVEIELFVAGRGDGRE